MSDIGMVVHMVAREIGETARRHAHAVEAILVEPMRRSFESKMADAFTGDLVKLAMQRDRIWRGERAVDSALRRNQPDRSDARRGMAEPLPDLPCKRRDRGLAAGAGDGGDCGRLAGKDLRRGKRQRVARIR